MDEKECGRLENKVSQALAVRLPADPPRGWCISATSPPNGPLTHPPGTIEVAHYRLSA